ncbi:GBP2 protein, partial [Crotophaga sulcirostris]|nr:GBP2 protein [Crotophaga sulcirostris]
SPAAGSQGLFFQGNSKNDTWVFVLTVLLSNTLIYKSKGSFDQHPTPSNALKLAERVKLKAAPKKSEDGLEDSAQLVSYFPARVRAVWDFTLQLEKHGKEISADEHLENTLGSEAGKG